MMILKIIFFLLILLLVISAFIYYKSVNYATYTLKPDRSKFDKYRTQADFDKLARELVSKMNFKEKIDQMYGEKRWHSVPKFLINLMIKKRFPHVYVGRNERLNIPPWVLSDGPRGARVLDKNIKSVTTFPVAMARGASWDTDLERRINEATAIEMRANKTNYAATPCINLLRHPAWGRAQETYGEDPWLLGQMGVAAVHGIQSHNVMACPKHFAVNSIENSRWIVDVDLDDRTLREVYLPHFKKVIQEGNAASIMSAYNWVQGDQCGANKKLLTDILRTEWGFQGFVSTDWIFGLYDGIGGVKAGLDVEMPWQQAYKYDSIKQGIEAGEITEKQIDEIVIRILRTRLAYAFAEDKMEYTQDLIANPKHIELAKEAAEKSMVLLKNENMLPFSKTQNKKIAVIGRIADLPNTGDQGSSDSTAPYVVTPYEGIKKLNESLGNEVILNDGSDLEAAKKIAQEADEVILIVGYTFEEEGEYMKHTRDEVVASAKAQKLVGKKGLGGDRMSLQLVAQDESLINTIAPLNNKLLVVYVGGSAIDMSSWQDQVPAILFAWYAGMEGGNALANIIYGNKNPSGKLPFTIASNEKDYPFFNPYTDKIKYEYYHGYSLFEKEKKPVDYPFGFGLSYTSFEYAEPVISTNDLSENDTLIASIKIKNTGNVSGAEIAQLYIGFRNSTIDRPIKLLRGFKKVQLNPEEEKQLRFSVPVKELGFYNPETKQWEIEKMEYELYLGSSSDKKDLQELSFHVH